MTLNTSYSAPIIMSAARKFCEALPILLTQAQGLQQTAGSLSASSELTTAQVSLIMLIEKKPFWEA